MKKILAGILLIASTNAMAGFISPISATALSSSINTPTALIVDATSANYIAPSPISGGAGTSNWTNSDFNTWTFDFGTTYSVTGAFIWDYYGHSPSNWTMAFFDGSSGAGANLGQVGFSFVPSLSSSLHTISFAPVDGVRSVTLANTNTSTRGGVGLSEVAFNVPEPATVFLLGVGLLGFAGMRKKNAKAV